MSIAISMRALALLTAIVALLLLLPADAADAQWGPVTVAELDAAEARWEVMGPDSYQFSGGQVGVHSGVSAVYTVEATGVISRITMPGDLPGPINTAMTIDAMFDHMREALAKGDPVSADFDPIDGHPRQYSTHAFTSSLSPPPGSGWTITGVLPTTTPVLCGSQPATMFGTAGDDRLFGSEYGDVIVGFDGDDQLSGGRGDDYICGGAGDDGLYGQKPSNLIIDYFGTPPPPRSDDDVLFGGPGRDTIEGSAGDDLMYGEGGHDHMVGENGNDTMYGQTGADRMDGGFGDDRMFGGPGYDTMHGSYGDDFVQGSGGNDRLYGEDGNDSLFGKAGDDEMHGGDDADNLYGAGGNDRAFGNDGNDRIQGAGGVDILDGGNGDDVLFGQNDDDALTGGPGVDVLYGAAGNDLLRGGPGDDNLQGARGDDDLDGGDGNDVLFGQSGDDDLRGGTGDNSCYQGAGSGVRTNCDAATVQSEDVWTLVGGMHRGQPVGVVSPTGQRTTLTITGSTITGFRDCNTYVGPVFRDGITFIADDPQSTVVACPTNTDGDYYGALDNVYSASLSLLGNQRTLTLTGRDTTLTFAPSASS